MDLRRETWERHNSAVRRFALHLCGDPTLAEDLASEAFVRLWTTPSTISTETVRGYLLTIVRNLYARSRRRAHASVPVPDDVADEAAGADEQVEARESAAEVRRALASLDVADREALLLRHDGELSYRDIASALGTTPGAARVRVHRAHRKLLARLTSAAADKEQP